MANSTEDYLGKKNIGDLALETLLAKKPWRMSSYRHTFMMHRFSISPYTYNDAQCQVHRIKLVCAHAGASVLLLAKV